MSGARGCRIDMESESTAVRIKARLADVSFWPAFWEVALTAVLALLVTAMDIHLSTQVGLLANPPYYDGIAYMLNAKSLFYQLKRESINVGTLMGQLVIHNTLWQSLMLVSFFMLGEGEWQAYAVRFWPIFLLLLLVARVIRRRSGARLAWTAVAFTCLVPTISVGLRSSFLEFLTARVYFPHEWYLADLRADLLLAVLLLWVVVPLLEDLRRSHSTLTRRTCLVSGISAGLAVTVKPSAFPEVLFVCACALVYVLITNRRPVAVLRSLAWAMLSFIIIVAPWALVGGATIWIEYIYANSTVYAILWSNPDATILSEATYYWRLFPVHFGPVESWAILGAGIGAFVYMLWKRHVDKALIGYLCISTALWLLASAAPAKNFFIGLPYCFLLWVFSWIALAQVVHVRIRRRRLTSYVMILLVCSYAGTMIVGGFYSVGKSPIYDTGVRWAASENRLVTQQIATDLRSFLTANDTFLPVAAWGYPATLQYHMVDLEGRYPQYVWIDPLASPEKVVRTIESSGACKAILMYEKDIEEVAKSWPSEFIKPVYFPVMRAIQEWVRGPESPFRLVKTYQIYVFPIPFQVTNVKDLTILLYIRKSLDSLRSHEAMPSQTQVMPRTVASTCRPETRVRRWQVVGNVVGAPSKSRHKSNLSR